MAVTQLDIAGYRSVQKLSLPLGRVNVVVGPNGSGKTNLYRALYLLTAAAGGQGCGLVVWRGDEVPGV